MADAVQDKPRKARAYLEGLTPSSMDLLDWDFFRKSSALLYERDRADAVRAVRREGSSVPGHWLHLMEN